MSAAGGLDIVDAQVHLYAEDAAPFPWDQAVYADPALAGMVGRFRDRLPHGPTEAMLAEMDAQHVQGALVVSPSIYAYDSSYSVDAYRRHPDRFRVVGLVDSSRDDIEDALLAWSEDPAFLGLRLSLHGDAAVERFLAGGHDRMLAAAQSAGLRVCMNAPGRFDLYGRVARMFPDLQLIVDHLGLFEIPMLDPVYGDTFAKLDGLLGLAGFEQVAVKFTSLPLLSREPYPHLDVWPHLLRVIAAFGPERLMWGSDQTVFEHDYGETVDVIRATDEIGSADKALILGASLRRIWGWPLEDGERSRR